MNNFLDNDILFLIGFILLVKFLENINPWIVFFGGSIAIIVGIFKIIDLYFSIRDKIDARRERKKNLKK